MNLALLGANGRTGREVLRRALQAGDTVTAVVRTEDRLSDVSHPRLSVRADDVRDPGALAAILPGHDAVISALGPRLPTRAACAIYPESAAAIVHAMQGSGVSRLLVISTALLYPDDRLPGRMLRWIARHNARGASAMEDVILASELDWTIARVGFLDRTSAQACRVGVGALPDGGDSVSRAAVARFLLTEARRGGHLRAVVGLGA